MGSLRILSVVTLASPDGAYGGPLRVAVNQAKELRARGHEVSLAAGHRGYPAGGEPTDIEGVPAKLFPARRLVPRTGFAGLAAPGLLRFVWQQVRNYDVVHIHVARDLVTLPVAHAALLRKVPYVLQPHGMINASDHPLARLMDPVLTLPVLRKAARVLYLTPVEHDDLAGLVGRTSRLELLINGVPRTDLVASPETPEVLYLARLAPRKRPTLMVDIANALAPQFSNYRFRIVGPDEGEGARVEAAIGESVADVIWEGALPLNRTLERMSRAGVYVLPSVDEPFGMSVLEAMSVGLPVVITDRCGLASLVRDNGAGVVTDPSVEALISGTRMIMANPGLAQRMGLAGRTFAREQLGMSVIAGQLEKIYAAALR